MIARLSFEPFYYSQKDVGAFTSRISRPTRAKLNDHGKFLHLILKVCPKTVRRWNFPICFLGKKPEAQDGKFHHQAAFAMIRRLPTGAGMRG
jgi:hypothetical protein